MNELEMRRSALMQSRSGGIDWETIARGMVDGVTEFELVDFPAKSDNYRFYGRQGLTSATLDQQVTSIGERCFANCTQMASVILPSGLLSIGFGAFDSCRGLRNITIPSSVTSIAAYAFINCKGLDYIIFEPMIPPTLASNNAFSNTTCLIYVPDASVNDYKAAANWSSLASRIFPISDLTT